MLYYVTLELFICEYEKTSCSFQEADSPSQAEYNALYGETHNTDGVPSFDAWCEGSDDWEDDYMIYRVYSCVEIPEPLASQIREHDRINVFEE